MGARYLGAAAETVYGTAVAPARFFEARSVGLNNVQTYDELDAYRAFSPVGMDLMSEHAEGPLELLANYNGIGILLEHLFGSVTKTGAADPWTHTFPATSGIPSTDRVGKSLSIEDRLDGALAIRYPGCKIEGWRHTMSVGERSTIQLDIVGKFGDNTVTPGTPSYPTLQTMIPKDMSLALDGGANEKCTRAVLEVTNPVDRPFFFGNTSFGLEPDRNAVLGVTLTCDVLWTDMTTFNKYKAHSDVAAVLKADQLSTPARSLTYTMTKTKIVSFAKQGSGRDRLTAQIVFRSFFNTVATENLSAVLVNGDTTT